jgi:hypothetical protein
MQQKQNPGGFQVLPLTDELPEIQYRYLPTKEIGETRKKYGIAFLYTR